MRPVTGVTATEAGIGAGTGHAGRPADELVWGTQTPAPAPTLSAGLRAPWAEPRLVGTPGSQPLRPGPAASPPQLAVKGGASGTRRPQEPIFFSTISQGLLFKAGNHLLTSRSFP